MPIPFIMPKFDMDQENATVVAWMKNEGDRIEYDDPVLTLRRTKLPLTYLPRPADPGSDQRQTGRCGARNDCDRLYSETG